MDLVYVVGVLAIEDELPVRRFLRASLAAHGFRVLEAETGKEGIALAASHNPDVVLLDLGLPDGDGVEWLRRLREWSRVPVIVISARGREDDKVIALIVPPARDAWKPPPMKMSFRSINSAAALNSILL